VERQIFSLNKGVKIFSNSFDSKRFKILAIKPAKNSQIQKLGTSSSKAKSWEKHPEQTGRKLQNQKGSV
jgi:hypothetical protein